MVIFLNYELEIKKCNDNLFHIFKKMYLNDGSIVCVQLRTNNMYNSSFIVNILIHKKFKSKQLIEFDFVEEKQAKIFKKFHESYLKKQKQ